MISKNSVIYQIVTDRFNNENNDLSNILYSADYNNCFGSYMGGNFRGILNKIDYLSDLGVTHIMISPVQDSPFYHGYCWKDSFKVNPRFGSEDSLKELISKFKERGIKTIMDYVTTHVHSENRIFQEKGINEKDSGWFVYPEELQKNPSYRKYLDDIVFKLTSGYPYNLSTINGSEYLGYFGLRDHPLFNLMNPEVMDWHKECISYWIKEFGFDDVRLDSAFLIPPEFLKNMRDYIDSNFEDVDLIGEYWDFEGRRGGTFGLLDGEFDIETTHILNKGFREDFFNKFRRNYHFSKRLAKDYKLISSIGNHDLPRFNEPPSLQKLVAISQFSLPQIPLIYYGDEVGLQQLNQGSDRIAQSRDVMRFDMHDNDLLEFYKKLINFRTSNDFSDINLSDMQLNDFRRLLTYRLETPDDNFYVLLNSEERSKLVNLSHLFKYAGNYEDVFDSSHGFLSYNDYEVFLAPNSYLILKEKDS